MMRLVLVVFFGKPRSEHAEHGKESPAVMTGPLLVLAIPAALAGFGFFAQPLPATCRMPTMPAARRADPRHRRDARRRRRRRSCSTAIARTTRSISRSSVAGSTSMNSTPGSSAGTQDLLAQHLRLHRSLDHRRRRRPRRERRDVGRRLAAAACSRSATCRPTPSSSASESSGSSTSLSSDDPAPHRLLSAARRARRSSLGAPGAQDIARRGRRSTLAREHRWRSLGFDRRSKGFSYVTSLPISAGVAAELHARRSMASA